MSPSSSTPSSSPSSASSALASLHALLIQLTESLPPNLAHLAPQFKLFVDKYAAISTKYHSLKTSHSSLKSSFKELTALKDELESKLQQLKQSSTTTTVSSVPATPLSTSKHSASSQPQSYSVPGTPSPIAHISQAEVDRLNFDVLRLKKKCNRVQELARKAHDENQSLRTELSRGSWVGSLLMGSPKPPPKDDELVRALGQIDVLTEELRTKIDENETLHQRIWSDGVEKDERERLLSQRLVEIKDQLATTEAELAASEEARVTLQEEAEHAEHQLRNELDAALSVVRQHDSKTAELTSSHLALLGEYEQLLDEVRYAFLDAGTFDDLHPLHASHAWADVDADHTFVPPIVAARSLALPAASLLSGQFSHATFQLLHAFVDELHAQFHRLKTQVASMLRYWREMKQAELAAMTPPPSTSVVSSPALDASHSVPARAHLTELNHLLQRNEELFERFLHDLDAVRIGAESLVRWKPSFGDGDGNGVGDGHSSPIVPHLSLNRLTDSLLALLKFFTRLVEHQVASLESRLAALASERGGGATIRPLVHHLVQQWSGVGLVLREASKSILFLPTRTGQQQHPTTNGVGATSDTFVRRHPAYAASLALPYAWPLMFLLATLQTESSPSSPPPPSASPTSSPAAASSSSSSYSHSFSTADPHWSTSPLPFLGTLQSSLTNLTSAFAVLIGQESAHSSSDIGMGMGMGGGGGGGGIGASTSKSPIPNFVLSNLATINKLVGNLPNTLLKYATQLAHRRQKLVDGNLQWLRQTRYRTTRARHGHGAPTKTRAQFDVTELTALVDTPRPSDDEARTGAETETDVDARHAHAPNLSVASPISVSSPHPPSYPRHAHAHAHGSAQVPPSSSGSVIHAMVHVRQQGSDYLRKLHQMDHAPSSALAAAAAAAAVAFTTSASQVTPVPAPVPYALALHHRQQLSSTKSLLDATESCRARLACELGESRDTCTELERARNELTRELDLLRRDYDQHRATLDATTSTLEATRAELVAVRARLDATELELDRSRARDTEHEQERVALDDAHRTRVHELTTRIGVLEQCESELRRELASVGATASVLRDELATAQEHAHGRIAHLEHALATRAHDAEHEREVIARQSTTLDEQSQALASQAHELHARTASLVERERELRRRDTELARVHQVLELARQRARRRSDELRCMLERALHFVDVRVTPTRDFDTDLDPLVRPKAREDVPFVEIRIEALVQMRASELEALQQRAEAATATAVADDDDDAVVVRDATPLLALPEAAVVPPPEVSSITTTSMPLHARVELSASAPIVLSIDASAPVLTLEQSTEVDLSERSNLSPDSSVGFGGSGGIVVPPSPSQLLVEMHSCADHLLAVKDQSPRTADVAIQVESEEIDCGDIDASHEQLATHVSNASDRTAQATDENETHLDEDAREVETAEHDHDLEQEHTSDDSLAGPTTTSQPVSPSKDSFTDAATESIVQSDSIVHDHDTDVGSDSILVPSTAAAMNVLHPYHSSSHARLSTDEIDPNDLCEEEEEDADREDEDEDEDDIGAIDPSSHPLATMQTHAASSAPSPLVTRTRARAASRDENDVDAADEDVASPSTSVDALVAPPVDEESARHTQVLLDRIASQECALESLESRLATSNATALGHVRHIEHLTERLVTLETAHEDANARAAKAEAEVARLHEVMKSTKSNYEQMNVELTMKICELTEQLASQDAGARKQNGMGRR